MDVLKNIFGGGTPDNSEQRAQQYQQGYQNGQGQYANLDPQEVASTYQRTVQYAPPEVVQQAHEQVFSQLPSQAQQQIVDQFQRAHNDPNQAIPVPAVQRRRAAGLRPRPAGRDGPAGAAAAAGPVAAGAGTGWRTEQPDGEDGDGRGCGDRRAAPHGQQPGGRRPPRQHPGPALDGVAPGAAGAVPGA